MLKFDLVIQRDESRFIWNLYVQGNAVSCLNGEFTWAELVNNKELKVSLETLLSAFSAYAPTVLNAFDEAAQLLLGRHLYQLVFHAAPETLFSDREAIALRVVSDDAFILRIPWNVLSRDNTFLVLENWHITVATQQYCESHAVHFASLPRLLLVCQDVPYGDTISAQSHADDLSQFFHRRHHAYMEPHLLTVASSWNAFVQHTAKQSWDVIYFYGHGKRNADGASLLFAGELFADESASVIEVSMVKLADVLKEHPPKLLYLNACGSGSNGIAGSVTQLSRWIPALVVNRTDAYADAAREQARIFLEYTVLYHYPPHTAISLAYSAKGHGLAAIRWMTPILFQHYTQWEFPESCVQHFVSKDIHWHLKLDRTEQFSRIFLRTSDILQENNLKTLVFFWYGTGEQGVERFHERIPCELLKRFHNLMLESFTFHWPVHVRDANIAWQTMLFETFDIPYLDALPGKLRDLGRSGDQHTVLYCRFESLRDGMPVELLIWRTLLIGGVMKFILG